MVRLPPALITVVLLALLMPALIAEDGHDQDQTAGSPRRGPELAEHLWRDLDSPWLNLIPEYRQLRSQLVLAFFPRWPYRDGHPGYLILEPFFRADRRWRLWGGQLGLEASPVHPGNVALTGDLDSSLRLGASARLERSQGWTSDRRITSGESTATYALIRSPRARLRLGLGLAVSSGGNVHGVGPLGTMQLDWYPGPPWEFGVGGDLGYLGGRPLVQLHLEAARQIRAVAARVGFRTPCAAYALHGPYLGVGYCF